MSPLDQCAFDPDAIENQLLPETLQWPQCSCPFGSLADDVLAAAVLTDLLERPEELAELAVLLACFEEDTRAA